MLKGTALAKHLTQRCPNVRWKIFTFEHLFLTSLVDSLSEVEAVGNQGADIELFCMPDLPEGAFDTVVLPTDSRASSELTRERLLDAGFLANRVHLIPDGVVLAPRRTEANQLAARAALAASTPRPVE